MVEDELPLREIARRVLERAGYAVVTAADGLEALAQLQAQSGIDVVLTDVLMPEMDGPALARVLRVERPGLPVLFMSGYAPTLSQGDIPVDAAILQKPFSPATLVEFLGRSVPRA